MGWVEYLLALTTVSSFIRFVLSSCNIFSRFSQQRNLHINLSTDCEAFIHPRLLPWYRAEYVAAAAALAMLQARGTKGERDWPLRVGPEWSESISTRTRKRCVDRAGKWRYKLINIYCSVVLVLSTCSACRTKCKWNVFFKRTCLSAWLVTVELRQHVTTRASKTKKSSMQNEDFMRSWLFRKGDFNFRFYHTYIYIYI